MELNSNLERYKGNTMHTQKKTYFILRLLPLILIYLVGCGQSKRPLGTDVLQQDTGNNSPNPGTVVGSSPPVPSPTPSGCAKDLSVNAQVLAGVPVVVGAPVQIQITASYCSGYSFLINGTTASFAASTIVTRTYSVAGNYTDGVIVNAFLSGSSLIAASKPVLFQVNVAPASDGPVTPPPPPPSSLNVDRLPVTQLGAAAVATVHVAGALFAQGGLTVNGHPVQPNVPFNLSPVAPNSPQYSMNIIASGPTGTAIRAISFTIPTCTLAVYSNTVNLPSPYTISVNGGLSAQGGATAYIAPDGVQGVFPSVLQQSVNFTASLPYTSEIKPISASVVNQIGDASSCSTTFTPGKIPLTAVSSPASGSVYYIQSFSVPGEGSTILTGVGGSTNYGYLTWSTAMTNSPIIVGAVNGRSVSCAYNEVMVGWSSFTGNAIYCKAIDPSARIMGVRGLTNVRWGMGVSQTCAQGEVVVGSLYTHYGDAYYYNIYCGTLAWN